MRTHSILLPRLTSAVVTGIAGIALAGFAAPMAGAAPDCSPATVQNTVDTVTQQAQAYLDTHPEGNRTLFTAALQSRPEAESTIKAYAAANPQEYAEFKAILTPLATVQDQCGVQVVPAQFQWAFDQFIG